MTREEQLFREMCEDTIPPFLKSAAEHGKQWSEDRLKKQGDMLIDLLAAHFKPPPTAEERAAFVAETNRVYEAMSPGDPFYEIVADAKKRFC